MNKVVDFTKINLWLIGNERTHLQINVGGRSVGKSFKAEYDRGYRSAQILIEEAVINHVECEESFILVIEKFITDQKGKTFPYIGYELGYNDAIKDVSKLLEEAKAQ